MREKYSNVIGICILDCCRYYEQDFKVMNKKYRNKKEDEQDYESKIASNSFLQIIAACHAGEKTDDESRLSDEIKKIVLQKIKEKGVLTFDMHDF